MTVSEEADRDLDTLYRLGVEMFGVAQADRYIDGLLGALDLIADFPAAARLRTELKPPIRAYPYKSHVILYDIEATGDVLVVRIRHGHEEWSDLAGDIPD
ncbi:type II toxin-antitoxin system RelE/ParE family toxin [Brevundimonas denitrificans]|nr:type II toxin-antitoxin system RelE/ParE family toxin [Brevundimonas denitrificans]